MHRRTSISAPTTLLAGAVLAAVAGVGQAQELFDPTAPPAILQMPAPEETAEAMEEALEPDGEAPEQAGAEGDAPTAEPAPPPPPPTPVLVVQEAIDGHWRSRALVDGRIVNPGDTVGTAEVTGIDDGAMAIATENGQDNEPVVDHGVVKRRPGDPVEDD